MKKRFCLILSIILLFCLSSNVFAADVGFILGDVDGNGTVQPEDARLALRAYVGLEKYKKDSNAFIAADINRDGRIGCDDARCILRASIGLENLSGDNEFDYLKSGNFYLKGTMTNSSGQQLPLEMAVTPDSVYMISVFEGATMGMLINNGTTYMIYPAEKAYLELTSTVLTAMGMSADDLITSADLDYSQYDLSKAVAVLTENVNGVDCTVYVFNNSAGSTKFFMNGDRLVRFALYDDAGIPDVINDVSYITDQVPADKINPPADYKEYKGITGMFSFIGLMENEIGE